MTTGMCKTIAIRSVWRCLPLVAKVSRSKAAELFHVKHYQPSLLKVS
jgi:hypothetical protein